MTRKNHHREIDGRGVQVEAAGGTRQVSLRAEIDTSPPFGSVKEAVCLFGGSGPWLPYYKFKEHDLDDVDMKRVEEQATALEKDLIVKELETLDVLEELTTTKKVVEELKIQLQRRCTKDRYAGTPDWYSGSSPDFILKELRQAKLDLGKTMYDLGVIQASVECLNRKMKKDKHLLRKTREKLCSDFAGVLSLADELKQARENDKPRRTAHSDSSSKHSCDTDAQDLLKTAELRLIAARKMEEAARATETLALSEIKVLTRKDGGSGCAFLDQERVCHHRTYQNPNSLKEKAMANVSNMPIMKRLKDAREELKHDLEAALDKVGIANCSVVAELMGEDDYEGSSPGDQNDKVSAPSLKCSERRRKAGPETVEDDGGGRQKVALSDMLHEKRGDMEFHASAENNAGGGNKRGVPQRRKLGFIHIALPLTKLNKKKVKDFSI